MNAVITSAPTMENPDAIEDITELRERLNRANHTMLALSGRLHEMNTLVHNQATLIGSLVDAHEINDVDGIRLQLKILSERRASFSKSTGRAH